MGTKIVAALKRILDFLLSLSKMWRGVRTTDPVESRPSASPPPSRDTEVLPASIRREKVSMTFYHPITLSEESSWRVYKGAGNETVEVEGITGTLSWPKRFVNGLRMEGTAVTPLGVVQYDGKKFYLLPAEFPWGAGAYDNPLVPFISIAVDAGSIRDQRPSFIHLKTKCVIQELRGKSMPNGTMHDGVVYAADTGGRIIGPHIDLFVRSRKDLEVMERMFSTGPDHKIYVTMDIPV